jgi:hypothetical protein
MSSVSRLALVLILLPMTASCAERPSTTPPTPLQSASPASPASTSTQSAWLQSLQSKWTQVALGTVFPSPVDPLFEPSQTPNPEGSPTPYPTFSRLAVTKRAPPRAQCPPFVYPGPLSTGLTLETLDPAHLVPLVQSLLTTGASYRYVASTINSDIGIQDLVYTADLTGDAIPELVLRQFFNTVVIGCKAGANETLLDYVVGDSVDGGPSLTNVGDMNLDGIPEVLVEYHATTAGMTTVDILEWGGTSFISLIRPSHGRDAVQTSRLAKALYWYQEDWIDLLPDASGLAYDSSGNAAYANGRAATVIRDIDGNGTKELILVDHGPTHWDTLRNYGPWRGWKATFQWDGQHFLYSDLEMDAPIYRFQAVQDADRQFLLGRYDEAISLYQDVIFSDKLEWATDARTRYLFDTSHGDISTPTEVPPLADPSEYPALAAYSRYRILVHHTSRGWFDEGAIVMNTLRAKFGLDPVAAPYVEAAEKFWTSFQATNDIATACDTVIQYFRQYPRLLLPLGGPSDALQSHQYSAEDTCPFPSAP